MITGYEKLLALRHKKTHEEVSGYQERITIEKYPLKYETPQVSEKYQAVSDEQTPSTSLVHGNGEWIKNVAKLAVTGQLTGPLPVSVKPSYQYILGQKVWFCPNLEAAGNKAPDLAFIPEELPIIIPLLIENRELAATLISAKQIFGATIIDSALSGLEAEEPIDSKSGSDSSPEPNEYETLHQTGTQLPDQNTSNDHNDDKAPSPREILPSPGRHLVIIRSVKGYLHNFPDYTGPRARIEMEIMEGPDVGKILVDNVSLPHPQESKGMCQRRVRIAYRLGLIPRGTEGTFQINWKPLEGVVCWVDLAYKNFSGRMVHMIDNYELVEYGAHTQPAPPPPRGRRRSETCR